MELEKLQKIIAEVLNVDTEEVTWDTTFVDDLGADSLDKGRTFLYHKERIKEQI